MVGHSSATNVHFLLKVSMHMLFARCTVCALHIGAAAPHLCTPALLRAQSCRISHRCCEQHHAGATTSSQQLNLKPSMCPCRKPARLRFLLLLRVPCRAHWCLRGGPPQTPSDLLPRWSHPIEPRRRACRRRHSPRASSIGPSTTSRISTASLLLSRREHPVLLYIFCDALL